MRRLVRLSSALAASAVLLASCDHNPLEPALRPGGISEVRGGAEVTAPTNLVIVAVSETQVDIAWTDNSGNETSFIVQRSSSQQPGVWGDHAILGANVTAFTDAGLQPLIQYCYSVRAFRKTGNNSLSSESSNTVCAQPGQPAAPTNAKAVAATTYRIDLTWQDNSSNEVSFQIERSEPGREETTTSTRNVAANVVAYADQPLAEGREYCYRVRAVRNFQNAFGWVYAYSAFSEPSCATTPLPSAPPPSAFTISAKPSGSTMAELTLQWTDPSPAPAQRIDRSTDGGAVWTTIPREESQGKFYDRGLVAESAVCYRVIGYNVAGDAEPSAASCTTPAAGPTNLAATEVDAETLDLSWTDNSSVEDGYVVWLVYGYGSADNAGWSEGAEIVAHLPANSTAWRGAKYPADPYNYYWYQVAAKKDGGLSNLSDAVDAKHPLPEQQ